MAQTRLHYFDSFGRAECTRIILRFTGTEFEDNRYNDQTFAEFKAQGISEFGQVPMLQIDGHNLVQSRAIEMYLLRKAGVITNDPVTEYKSESLIGFLEEIIMAISKFVWVDKDFEGLYKWSHDVLPGKLQIIENRLNSENTHLVGHTLSHADFAVFDFLTNYMLKPSKVEVHRPILESKAPRLLIFVQNFKTANPSIGAYIDSRGDSFN